MLTDSPSDYRGVKGGKRSTTRAKAPLRTHLYDAALEADSIVPRGPEPEDAAFSCNQRH